MSALPPHFLFKKAKRCRDPVGACLWVLDITQACVAWGIQNGARPVRIFQSVAAGLLDALLLMAAQKTAALGLTLHFFIAFSAAAVYYVASRKIRFLTARAVHRWFCFTARRSGCS